MKHTNTPTIFAGGGVGEHFTFLYIFSPYTFHNVF